MKRRGLFRVPLLGAGIGLLLLLITVVAKLLEVSGVDVTHYRQLMGSTQHATHLTSNQSAIQHRKGVDKTLYRYTDEGRIAYQLYSDASQLVIYPTPAGLAMVEKHDHLHGVIDGQLVEAKEASYDYRGDHFQAGQVTVTNDVALWTGSAEQVTGSLLNSHAPCDAKEIRFLSKKEGSSLASDHFTYDRDQQLCTLSGAVELIHGKGFTAHADKALYSLQDKQPLPQVTLLPEGTNGTCSLTDQLDNRLAGSRIFIDCTTATLICDDAKGVIHLPQAVEVAAKKLSTGWEQGWITLEGDAKIASAHLGFVEGESGRIVVDQTTKAVAALHFEGHVKVVSGRDESARGDHYALSDTLDYSPATDELSFGAKEGERVLLYDLKQGIEMSAPSVKVVAVTSAERKVQGIGDVRFCLQGHELERLKSNFNLHTYRETADDQ